MPVPLPCPVAPRKRQVLQVCGRRRGLGRAITVWLEVRDAWCWGCTNSYQYGLGGKVGRLVGCHKGGVGQVTSRQGMRCAARRHQHLLCFMTLHKERNIQQSLPAETGLGRAKGINTTWRRDVFYQQPGGPENGKASTDPTHCPDRPRPWARPIGLRSTALTHLYTPFHTYAHTERRRLWVSAGVYRAPVPSRASRLQLRSRPGVQASRGVCNWIGWRSPTV